MLTQEITHNSFQLSINQKVYIIPNNHFHFIDISHDMNMLELWVDKKNKSRSRGMVIQDSFYTPSHTPEVTKIEAKDMTYEIPKIQLKAFITGEMKRFERKILPTQIQIIFTKSNPLKVISHE